MNQPMQQTPKVVTALVLALIALICMTACYSCRSTETDPAKITRQVGDFEPPMVRILEIMQTEGYPVEAYIETFRQPEGTEIAVLELEPLLGHLERYQAELETLEEEGTATPRQLMDMGFVEGWVLALGNLIREGVE